MAIELAYWDGRGLMEVPRMLLALADRSYTDGRYTTDADKADGTRSKLYDEIKDKLGANLGRMPVLRTEGGDVGQSAAINFYLASELGFMGSSTLEGAQILAIQEHLKEMMTAFRSVIPYGSEPTDELVAKWFDTGADDVSPTAAADMSKRKERFAKWFFGRIEGIVGAGGCAVGGKLSLADVLIYNTFGEVLEAAQAPDGMPSWKREPFTSKARTDAALSSCPKLAAIVENVRSNEKVTKYLAERGPQRF